MLRAEYDQHVGAIHNLFINIDSIPTLYISKIII